MKAKRHALFVSRYPRININHKTTFPDLPFITKYVDYIKAKTIGGMKAVIRFGEMASFLIVRPNILFDHFAQTLFV